MYSIRFWKDWPSVYRGIFWSGILLSIVSFLFLWISNFASPAPTIKTEHVQQLETQEFGLHSFSLGNFEITVPADNHLVFERVMGGPLIPQPYVSYPFLGVLIIFMIMGLSIITTLSRFWYFIAMGLFILFLVSLRIEAVRLYNLANKIPTIGILILYGGLSYYFQALSPSSSFIKRFFGFSAITIVVAALIYSFSPLEQPFLHLAANGITVAILLSLLFIFMVAVEIPASFIIVITRSLRPTKSLRHFLILNAIYLVNLVLAYAEMKGFIRWNFLTVNFFLLLTASAILGLWGFRQRESLYENILPANPFGIFLYTALAIVCFFSIGYFLFTANDPALQFLKDAIIYGHIGYGIIFFAYVLANFTPMLAKNLPVHKILYKPQTMPYFTFRLAGLIATFAFFAYSNWRVSVNQVFAGYYNAYADVYLAQGESQLAESYYRRSIFYALRNHHAHYALANIEEERLDYQKEKEQYTQAADTRPTELSYLNLGQAYERDHALLESTIALNQGLKDFPSSGSLKNALGLVYARLNLKDSALLMINEARSNSSFQSEAETNLIGLSAKFSINYPADSLYQLMSSGKLGVKSNAVALANTQGLKLTFSADPGNDTTLTIYSASLLNNHFLNQLADVDTALLAKAIQLARKPSNSHFKDPILFSASHAYYASGHLSKAFKLLREAAFLSQNGKFYNVLGLWALEQGDAETAQTEFNYALNQNYKPALINMAFALTETGQRVKALNLWDSLKQTVDTAQLKIANEMFSLLTLDETRATESSEKEKYNYAYFRLSLSDSLEFKKTLNSITDTELKARIIFERCKKLWRADELQLTNQLFAQLKGLRVRDKDLHDRIILFSLELLAANEDWTGLERELKTEISFAGHQPFKKDYFEARLYEQKGNAEEARKLYEPLATCNPYFEEAIINSLRFLHSDKDKLKTFNFLVEALTLNPNSIKLLKAYTLESAKLGFAEYAQETLDKLKARMRPASFARFVNENRELFEVVPD